MGYGYRVAENAETVMGFPYEGIDPEHPEFHEDDHAFAWDDWVAMVLSLTGKAWRPVTSGKWRDGHPGGRVIAQSELHELLIEEDRGGYGYAYLSVVVRPNLPESCEGGDPWICANEKRKGTLARANLGRVAKSLFDRLASKTELRVPQGYTSTPYTG